MALAVLLSDDSLSAENEGDLQNDDQECGSERLDQGGNGPGGDLTVTRANVDQQRVELAVGARRDTNVEDLVAVRDEVELAGEVFLRNLRGVEESAEEEPEDLFDVHGQAGGAVSGVVVVVTRSQSMHDGRDNRDIQQRLRSNLPHSDRLGIRVLVMKYPVHVYEEGEESEDGGQWDVEMFGALVERQVGAVVEVQLGAAEAVQADGGVIGEEADVVSVRRVRLEAVGAATAQEQAETDDEAGQ